MNPIKLWNLKYFFDLGVWHLETTFGPLVPRRRIKPYVQNRSCNFHKQAIIFSRIMRWIQWNYEISKKFLILGSGTRKLHQGHLGHLAPADGSGHMSRTIAAIFTNRPSFSQESWDKSNKFLKSQNFFWSLGLPPGNYIWETWVQKTYQAICPEL